MWNHRFPGFSRIKPELSFPSVTSVLSVVKSTFDCLSNPPRQPLLRLARHLMFPDAQHAPAAGAEGAANEPVAGHVFRQLALPKRAVIHRHVRVPRALMPETAVNEDGQPEFGEDEVGFAAAADDRQLTYDRLSL
jgi:hypothetical protein